MLIFLLKNVSSFCSAKATHIFSAKNIRILYIESPKTVNEMILNGLVKLICFEQLGQGHLPYDTCPTIWKTCSTTQIIAGWVANPVDSDQTSHFVASDLGLHWLLRPVCPNTLLW